MVTTFPFSHEIRVMEGRSSVRRVLFFLGTRKLTGLYPRGGGSRSDGVQACYKAPWRSALQKSMQEKARKCVVTRKWHPRFLGTRLGAQQGTVGTEPLDPRLTEHWAFLGSGGSETPADDQALSFQRRKRGVSKSVPPSMKQGP